MLTIPLHMCFKGSRRYLQGADIFNSVLAALAATPPSIVSASNFYLTLHNMAHRQCDMHLVQTDSTANLDPAACIIAQFGTRSADTKLHGWLTESGREVDCRLPYAEEEIIATTAVNGNSIAHIGESAFTPMEVLVAMTKMLHLTLHPQRDGRWIVTKLELDALPLPRLVNGLRVELLQNLHNRITKCRISQEQAFLGHIYFSLVAA